MAHSEKLTGTVDMFWPGECSASDNGAETHLREVESQIRHEEPIEPFTSNILNRLRARRAKGIKWTEEEALADSERMPWTFNESTDEGSEDSDNESDNAKHNQKKRKYT